MGGGISSVLCFDFDGTLVDPHSRQAIDSSLIECLAELKSRNAVWVVNSGRSLFQLLEGFQVHGMTMLPDYIIAQESELFQPGPYNRWVPFGEWNANCLSDHRKVFKKGSRALKKIRKFIETSTGASLFPLEEGPGGVVAQNEEEMEIICEYIESERRSLPLLGYQRNSVYLRFSHVHYNKGSTLGELGRLLGVPPEAIFAAGDNHNDVAMLDGTYARAVACPGNAIPGVKDLVQSRRGYVAEAPFSQGIAEAVKHFYFSS
jgi:hydroxymethylpyrimidine pyrophosphatase-like HAD family hydrolase